MTPGIRMTNFHGVIVRRAALTEHNIALESILDAFETVAPLDLDETLISFGPCFGEDEVNEFTRRLSKLGLVFYDDFFDITLTHRNGVPSVPNSPNRQEVTESAC